MDMQNYQNMYQKIEIPKDMDERLRQRMAQELNKNKTKRINAYRPIVAFAAALAFIVCLAQFDPVVAAAKRFVNYIKYTFVVTDEDGNEVNVDMEGEFLTLSKDAPKDTCYLDSMAEAGDVIGILWSDVI